jgi:septum site-determining protein MinC
MALTVAPAAPLGAWFAALDEHLGRTAALFADRPIVADLAAALEPGERPECVLRALDGLAARNLRVIGVEGVDPALLSGTRWARLPTILHGRHESAADATSPASANPLTGPTRAAPSLMIDRPVRSGQSVYFEEGDVIVIGSIASGAEVIAGGSIHVYGALRGRARSAAKPSPWLTTTGPRGLRTLPAGGLVGRFERLDDQVPQGPSCGRPGAAAGRRRALPRG